MKSVATNNYRSCNYSLILLLVLLQIMIEGSSAFVTQNRRFISTTNKGLFQSADALSKSPNDEDNATSSIRFLGKGSNAIVRPGVILVAPKHEYDHFLMKSAVFIFAIGLNDYDESVVRGVIVDHPTAFTMGEMSSGAVYGSLAHNILFRGGDSGNDSAMLLHCRGGDIISSGNGEIGDSGIYEGGMQESMDTVDDDKEGVTVDDFKFFFNYMEFTEKELENMLLEEDSEGDAWISMEVSPEVILNSDYNRGSAWSYLRNQAKRRQL